MSKTKTIRVNLSDLALLRQEAKANPGVVEI